MSSELEQAKKDLEERFSELQGIPSQAVLPFIMGMFDKAKKRLSLEHSRLILMYVKNEEAPAGLRHVIRQFVDKEIDSEKAEAEIDRIKAIYETAAEELGYS